MYDYEEERKWQAEDIILGMADIIYENRRLRLELEAAKEYENYFQSLADACEDLQEESNTIYNDAYEDEWRECHTADLMADMEDMLDELTIRE